MSVPLTGAVLSGMTHTGAIIPSVTVVNSLGTQAKADVNAEIIDTLVTDVYSEPGSGAPALSASISTKVGYLYKAFRNKVTQTASAMSIYADDGTTVDQGATVSDDGTTYTRGEIGAG
jgi:hypothetical protein